MARDITQHTLVTGHLKEHVESVPEELTMMIPFNMTTVNNGQLDYVLRKEALVSTSASIVVSLVNRNELLSFLIFQMFALVM